MHVYEKPTGISGWLLGFVTHLELLQWHPVSQKPSLEVVQTDSQEDLRHNPATVGSHADGSVFVWPEIGRRDAHGAKPGPVHLISAGGQDQEGRYGGIRLIQKGPRYRQDEREGCEAV